MPGRFEKRMTAVLALAAAAQLLLGLWRARLIGSSPLPGVVLAGVVALTGGLWLLKRRQLPGGGLANFAALLAATAGVLSAMSAANAPFIGALARISVPFFAFATAALLASAKQESRFAALAAGAFLLSLALLQYDLTLDALWESSLSASSVAPWWNLRAGCGKTTRATREEGTYIAGYARERETMRVEIHSRQGNVVVGLLGVVYAISGAVLFTIHFMQTWGAASLIDRAIQLLLIGVIAVSAWFISIAAHGLGIRLDRRSARGGAHSPA